MKNKVSIYYLKDPRNGYVFYVGATKRNLKIRLNDHLSEANDGIMARGVAYIRKCLIRDIIKSNKKPVIKLILQCPLSDAGGMEEKYFYLYSTKKNILLQQQGHFTYTKSRGIYFKNAAAN